MIENKTISQRFQALNCSFNNFELDGFLLHYNVCRAKVNIYVNRHGKCA